MHTYDWQRECQPSLRTELEHAISSTRGEAGHVGPVSEHYHALSKMKFIDHCDKCGILPRHPVAGEYESEHRPVAGQKLRRAQKNLVDSFDLGLFYTGNLLAWRHLAITLRERLGHLVGGATQCFVLEKQKRV